MSVEADSPFSSWTALFVLKKFSSCQEAAGWEGRLFQGEGGLYPFFARDANLAFGMCSGGLIIRT